MRNATIATRPPGPQASPFGYQAPSRHKSLIPKLLDLYPAHVKEFVPLSGNGAQSSREIE